MEFDAFSAILAATVLILAFYPSQRSNRSQILCRQQATASPTRNPSESAIYRNTATPHPHPLTSYVKREFRSLTDLLQKNSDQISNLKVFGNCAYGDFVAKYKGLGSALKRGGDKIGVFLNFGEEWIISDIACIEAGKTSVHVPFSYELDALIFALNETKLDCLITDELHWNQVLGIADQIPYLKIAIVVGKNIKKSQAIITMPFSDAVSGTSDEFAVTNSQVDRIISIIYKEVTDGEIKSIEITESNILASISSISGLFANKLSESNSIYFGELEPTMDKRIFSFWAIKEGWYIHFKTNDFMSDLLNLQPMILVADNTMLEIIDKDLNSVCESSSVLAKWSLKFGLARKEALVQFDEEHDTIWDQLILRRFRNRVGKNLKVIISKGTDLDLLIRLKVKLDVTAVQFFGIPETMELGFSTRFDEYKLPFGSHVGFPLSSLEYKLQDVKEIGLCASNKNPGGEILLRGPGLVRPRDINESSEDGWYATGLLGQVNPNLTLAILGSKNDYDKSQVIR